MSEFTTLVVAKAPVAGLAKTRLCPPLTPAEAADLAAAALLDTLALASDAVEHDRSRVVVSYTGVFADAARASALADAMAGCRLIEQRGSTFGERLSNAHHDVAVLGAAVVQIGMDTPHADPAVLQEAATSVSTLARRAAIGSATDGGWWLLALSDPAAAKVLSGVPMSRDDTAALTRQRLIGVGLSLVDVAPLTDVDTWDDAVAVAKAHPDLQFSAAVRSLLTSH